MKYRIKNILYKTLDKVLEPEILDDDKRKETAKAFSLAIFDGRMGIREAEDYEYIGSSMGRSIFKNTVTGLYLD